MIAQQNLIKTFEPKLLDFEYLGAPKIDAQPGPKYSNINNFGF